MSPDSPDIRGRIRALKSLPTMPGVVRKLLSMVETDTDSTAEVAEIIASDQVFTAKVLKIVNSPFYGFPGRISTINHALVLLGFNVIKGIVLSASVIDYMAEAMAGLWAHSIGTAAAASHIARAVGAEEPEEICTAGLLHDLGKVVLSVEMRQECDAVMAEVEQTKIPFIEAERRVLGGVTHCEIAGWLAEEWHLPARLREPMVLHHHPQVADLATEATCIVHLADIVTRALQFGSGGDPYVPPIAQFALDRLGLKMGSMAAILRSVDTEFEGIDISDFI